MGVFYMLLLNYDPYLSGTHNIIFYVCAATALQPATRR